MAGKPPGPGKYPLENREDGRQRFYGCSRVHEYEWISKLGEGTFGEVSKARSKKTGQLVALKKILMHNEKDGFPITALREIKLLKQLDHINILKLEEMAVERPKDTTKKSNMFMVTPYMDHDLSGLLQNPKVQFTEPQIKCYMQQLLEGCRYLHENKILHRDMKAANLLINNKGILQVADFGLARPYDDEPPKAGQGGGEATRDYTTLVVTRWYRPPELLLQLRRYTTAIDMWGVGCVFGEMFKRKPILAGDSDVGQAMLIFDLVGSPTEETMPGWHDLPGCGVTDFGNRRPRINQEFRELSPQGLSLLTEFLKLDWRKRINAIDALQHPYFHTHPLPARPQDLPTFEDSHELDRRKARNEKAKPPPAPAGGSVGIGPQGEYGFDGRRGPYDPRNAGRMPGGKPYTNGQGRRPYHNGGYANDYRGPRDDMAHDHNYRQPRPFDQQYHDRSRPPGQPYEEPYSRRPLPPPDVALPPRPPPPETEPYNGRLPPYRDDGRGPPPSRNRVAPIVHPPDSRLPHHEKQAAVVDTYIPPYSSADPNARPPPAATRNPGRRPPRDDGRPVSRGGGPGPITDYDDVLRYDEMNGIERGRGPPPNSGYDRRRSKSPRDRVRMPDRDRGPPRGDGYGSQEYHRR